MARILVVGGSLGGLMAGCILHRAGHDVQVLERSAVSLEGRGAGIVTHGSLRSALRAAGAVVDDTLGIAVASRVLLDREGRVESRWNCPQVLTSWGRLYALLRAALPARCHRLGARVQAVAQDDDGASVRLDGGETLAGDLVIGADGIRSGVRGQLLPAVQPVYAGYVAWRGVCDEAVLSRLTRSTLFDHFGFGVPPGEQMIGYPVAGTGDATAVGQRRWNFVWYRGVGDGAELQALMTDADGVHHPGGIAPHDVSWRSVAAMRQAARTLLAPQFAEICEKTAQPFLQPIADLVAPRMAFGRVALLGDAACVARPHVGMGVTKAGDDAVTLAAALARHGATPAALLDYEGARLRRCAAVVERGRRLGAYLEALRRGVDGARDAEDVMRQTAVDPAVFDEPVDEPADEPMPAAMPAG